MTVQHEGPDLAHNMGFRPRTEVRFSGLGRPENARGFCRNAPPRGTLLAASLPAEWRAYKPRRLLEELGVKASAAKAEQVLTDLINAHAQTLPLPDGLVVLPRGVDTTCHWSDPLTALALITKSSNAVWLRAKNPQLRLAWHQITLLVPAPWDANLQKDAP